MTADQQREIAVATAMQSYPLSNNLVLLAERAGRRGDYDAAKVLYAEAAAIQESLARNLPDGKPRTRSVFMASAAVLWEKSGAARRAESIIIIIPGHALSERKRQRPMKLPGGRMVAGPRTDEPDRRDWKAYVRMCVAQEIKEPLAGPLRLQVDVCRPTPSSTPKRPTKAYPWPWAWVSKPDVDNLVKPCFDAMKGVAYLDDAQVIDLSVRKHNAERWALRIILEAVDQQPVPEFGMAGANPGQGDG